MKCELTEIRSVDKHNHNSPHRINPYRMLCDAIDHDTTKLHGRWRSDELLTYLHTQAEPLYRDLLARMLCGGDYSFVPGTPAYEHWSQQPVGLYH